MACARARVQPRHRARIHFSRDAAARLQRKGRAAGQSRGRKDGEIRPVCPARARARNQGVAPIKIILIGNTYRLYELCRPVTDATSRPAPQFVCRLRSLPRRALTLRIRGLLERAQVAS